MVSAKSSHPGKAISLAEFSSPSLIVPALREQNISGIINELAQVLQREEYIPDLLPFYHAALNREFLLSTASKAGVAFPHVRMPGVRQLRFVLGRSQRPLEWNSQKAPGIEFVFLSAVPQSDISDYLLLTRSMVHLAKEGRLLESLRRAATANEMYAVLQRTRFK